MSRWVVGLIVVVVVVVVASCGGLYWGPYGWIFRSQEPTHTDVTENKKYWGGYKPGGEYVLQQDLFVLSINGGQAQLYAPAQDTYGESATREKYTVPSLEEYRESPGKRSYIVGLLPKGSRIRVVKFELYSFFEDTQLWIHAEPVEGSFKGRDMRIDSLSLAPGEGLTLSPKTEDLKEAESASQ